MITPILETNEKLFFNGREYFDAMLKDIEQATKNIAIETYGFYDDKLGKKIIEALNLAVRKGIEVRILVDGAGSRKWNGNITREIEKSGAQSRIFHPFPWQLWQWSRSKVKVPSILKAIYLLLKINSRNHRKICMIDKKIAYVGSFNICQHHMDKEQDGDGWRDTGVRLDNINLDELITSFEAAWNHVPIQERLRSLFLNIHKNPIFRLNNTRHRRRILYKDLLNKISKTKKRIWITNAYFVPDNFLLKKLIDAAQNGVDVRILLPHISDVAFMTWASNAFYEKLLKVGIRIFEYLPSMLHAKTLILDDWMLIGSSNLNHRSLLHDLEVDINIRQPESKATLEQQFLLDLEKAREIKLNNWQRHSLLKRIIGHALLYVKYFI